MVQGLLCPKVQGVGFLPSTTCIWSECYSRRGSASTADVYGNMSRVSLPTGRLGTGLTAELRPSKGVPTTTRKIGHTSTKGIVP